MPTTAVSDGCGDRLLVTAAAESNRQALDVWLGAVNLNWPTHPPVLVYDLGLGQPAREELARLGVAVRPVPAFYPHWQRHNTWKLWVLHDVPAREFLWINVGLLVLAPMDEAFEAIRGQGLLALTNGELCDWEASDAACRGCGVTPAFRLGKPALSGALIGFRKQGAPLAVLQRALEVAAVEEHIAPTEVTHRDAHAILSLLIHREIAGARLIELGSVIGRVSPGEMPGQKLWEHRGELRAQDVAHLTAHRGCGGEPYLPGVSQPPARTGALRQLYRAYWCFGRGEREEAARRLAAAFDLDATLVDDAPALARTLRRYEDRLHAFRDRPAGLPLFDLWALEQIRGIVGIPFARALRAALAMMPTRVNQGMALVRRQAP
jgi:hypothetical protein